MTFRSIGLDIEALVARTAGIFFSFLLWSHCKIQFLHFPAHLRDYWQMSLTKDHHVLTRSSKLAKTFAVPLKWLDGLKFMLTHISFCLAHLLPWEGCSKWKNVVYCMRSEVLSKEEEKMRMKSKARGREYVAVEFCTQCLWSWLLDGGIMMPLGRLQSATRANWCIVESCSLLRALSWARESSIWQKDERLIPLWPLKARKLKSRRLDSVPKVCKVCLGRHLQVRYWSGHWDASGLWECKVHSLY